MIFSYDGVHQEFYMPTEAPGIIDMPSMHYIAIRGKGDIESQKGDYKQAIEILFALVYSLKVYGIEDPRIDGYFQEGEQLLESFWWHEEGKEIDYKHKKDLNWMLAIRLPEFFLKEDLDKAIDKAKTLRSRQFSRIEYLTIHEGLCVRSIHVGPLEKSSKTIKSMHKFAKKHGFELDFSKDRMHHELYLYDARRTPRDKQRTEIRHPVKEIEK